MDELDFDGKKYFSSKRAAEVTGYAKDYVGQLCREGRVDARLVGRAWYVSESSIREHRFGGSNEAPEEAEVEKTKLTVAGDDPRAFLKKEVANTWGTSTYAPEPVDLVPTLHTRMSVDVFSEERTEQRNASVHHMQEVWQEWFNTNKESEVTVETVLIEEDDQAKESVVEAVPDEPVPVYKIPMHEPVRRDPDVYIERAIETDNTRTRPSPSVPTRRNTAPIKTGSSIVTKAALIALMLLVLSGTLLSLGYGDNFIANFHILPIDYLSGVTK